MVKGSTKLTSSSARPSGLNGLSSLPVVDNKRTLDKKVSSRFSRYKKSQSKDEASVIKDDASLYFHEDLHDDDDNLSKYAFSEANSVCGGITLDGNSVCGGITLDDESLYLQQHQQQQASRSSLNYFLDVDVDNSKSSLNYQNQNSYQFDNETSKLSFGFDHINDVLAKHEREKREHLLEESKEDDAVVLPMTTLTFCESTSTMGVDPTVTGSTLALATNELKDNYPAIPRTVCVEKKSKPQMTRASAAAAAAAIDESRFTPLSNGEDLAVQQKMYEKLKAFETATSKSLGADESSVHTASTFLTTTSSSIMDDAVLMGEDSCQQQRRRRPRRASATGGRTEYEKQSLQASMQSFHKSKKESKTKMSKWIPISIFRKSNHSNKNKNHTSEQQQVASLGDRRGSF